MTSPFTFVPLQQGKLPPVTLRKIYQASLAVVPNPFPWPRDPAIANPSFFNSAGTQAGRFGLLGFYNAVPAFQAADGNGLYALANLNYFTINSTGIFEANHTGYNAASGTNSVFNWSSSFPVRAVPGIAYFWSGSMLQSGSNPIYNFNKTPYFPLLFANRNVPLNFAADKYIYPPAGSTGQPFKGNQIWIAFDDALGEKPVMFIQLPVDSLVYEYVFNEYPLPGNYFGYANGEPVPVVLLKAGGPAMVLDPLRTQPNDSSVQKACPDPFTGSTLIQALNVRSTGPVTYYHYAFTNMYARFSLTGTNTWSIFVPGSSPIIFDDAVDDDLLNYAGSFSSPTLFPNGDWGILLQDRSNNYIIYGIRSNMREYYKISLSTSTPFISLGGGDPGDWGCDINGNFWFLTNNYRGSGYTSLYTTFGQPVINLLLPSPPLLTAVGLSCKDNDPCSGAWIG
jgi:hypothetical protein